MSVLVVENKKKWRETFSQGLRTKGYLVQVAESAEEAETQLRRMEFDVVVLNLHLIAQRDFLGEEVLAAIVRYSPLTPCIVVSGFPDQFMNTVGRYRYQVYQLLSKVDPENFDLRSLFETIEHATKDRELVRKLLAILDEHLSEQECKNVRQELTYYYNYPGFQPPPDLTNNTRKQNLGYMIAVLIDILGSDAIGTFCDIVRGLRPTDLKLGEALNEIYPVSNRPSRAKLDKKTVDEIEEFIIGNDLRTALERLRSINGYQFYAVPLLRQLTDLEERKRRNIITREVYGTEISRISNEILELIHS